MRFFAFKKRASDEEPFYRFELDTINLFNKQTLSNGDGGGKKSTRVMRLKDGSGLFERPSKPCQCGSEPACTEPGPWNTGS